MPFGFSGYSAQHNAICSICRVSRAQKLMRRCPWCEQFPVCPGCMLPVEENSEARLCYSCAIPKCNTCGWQGEDVQTLEYFFPTGRQDQPSHICPSCKQGGDVVASHTARRVPQGYYGSSDPLRIDKRARADIEEVLAKAQWS